MNTIAVLTQAETATYRTQELALVRANCDALLAASLRHDARIDLLIAAYQAEKAAIDAAYVVGVETAVAAIVALR